MVQAEYCEENYLEELIIDRFPSHLEISDRNLFDRFAKRVLKVRKLEIGNLRGTTETMRDEIFYFIR